MLPPPYSVEQDDIELPKLRYIHLWFCSPTNRTNVFSTNYGFGTEPRPPTPPKDPSGSPSALFTSPPILDLGPPSHQKLTALDGKFRLFKKILIDNIFSCNFTARNETSTLDSKVDRWQSWTMVRFQDGRSSRLVKFFFKTEKLWKLFNWKIGSRCCYCYNFDYIC
jgi:hypothetical protein